MSILKVTIGTELFRISKRMDMVDEHFSDESFPFLFFIFFVLFSFHLKNVFYQYLISWMILTAVHEFLANFSLINCNI